MNDDMCLQVLRSQMARVENSYFVVVPDADLYKKPEHVWTPRYLSTTLKKFQPRG